MEFKVGDRVKFIGGKDIGAESTLIGRLGTVVALLEEDSEGEMLSVVFDTGRLGLDEEGWYSHRFELVSQELKTTYNTTTVVEACAEVKKISDIVTSLQQDLQEIGNLSPGYVSIGVGSSHFRLGNLSEDHDSELRKLLIASREKNLADAEQLLKEKIEELSKTLQT